MKQVIRKNTFETNSSSVHSLVIQKAHYDCLFEKDPLFDDQDYSQFNETPDEFKFWNVRLKEHFTLTDDPEEIISYLYSLSIYLHYRPLEYKLKKLFPNCVFEKPLWELPNKEYPDYCDDESITAFCDCVQLYDFPTSPFTDDNLSMITDYCVSIIFHGWLSVWRDESFETLIQTEYSDRFAEHFNCKKEEIKDKFKENYIVIAEA